MKKKQIVLIGAGHAHVEVIRLLGLADRSQFEVTLLSESARTGYSGMMPGVIAGHYTRDQAEINVASLCARSGVRFVAQPVVRVAADANLVDTGAGQFRYDVLSVNTGSQPTMVPVHGGHHVPVKPFSRFLDTVHAFDDKHNVAIVGGGAASVEVLLALAHRARSRQNACTFTLVTAAHELIAGYPAPVRDAVERALRTYGATWQTQKTVVSADELGLLTSAGERIACDASLWATRAMASAFIQASDFARADDGFIRVDGFQRSVSHPNVFAVGDCASRAEGVLPKAGVVPVKQGPWLARALTHCASDTQVPAPFVFQKNALALLALGDKRATGARGKLTFTGTWVWYWKNWIDQRFMRQYG
jgi:selenide,water dikinase